MKGGISHNSNGHQVITIFVSFLFHQFLSCGLWLSTDMYTWGQWGSLALMNSEVNILQRKKVQESRRIIDIIPQLRGSHLTKRFIIECSRNRRIHRLPSVHCSLYCFLLVQDPRGSWLHTYPRITCLSTKGLLLLVCWIYFHPRSQ